MRGDGCGVVALGGRARMGERSGAGAGVRGGRVGAAAAGAHRPAAVACPQVASHRQVRGAVACGGAARRR